MAAGRQRQPQAGTGWYRLAQAGTAWHRRQVFRRRPAHKHATASGDRRVVVSVSSRSLPPLAAPAGGRYPRPRIWRPNSLMKPVASDGVYSLPMVKLANLPE